MSPLNDKHFQFDDVIARVQQALGATNTAQVAVALEFTSSAFANRKKSRSLPLEQILTLALHRGWDIRLLLTGQPTLLPGGALPLPPGLTAEQIAALTVLASHFHQTNQGSRT